MPGIHVTIESDTATNGFVRAGKAVPAGVAVALKSIGLDIQNTARLSMSRGSPRGRRYKRGKKWHTASAPGQPPATDTGDLMNHVVSQASRTFVEIGESGTRKEHGKHLEYGTSRMAARPWLMPAVEKHLPRLEGMIATEIARRS